MSNIVCKVSFDTAQWPERDRRCEERSRTVLAHGKLMVSGAEQICAVRNISPRGIGIESPALPLPGQRVEIEMRGLAASSAVVIWREPGQCGLAFENEQDLDAIFASRSPKAQTQSRGPRFVLELPAEVTFRVGTSRFETLDISAGGLKLRGKTDAQVGSYGVVALSGLAEELCGYVAWKTDDIVGLHFERPMSRDDLFNILCCRG